MRCPHCNQEHPVNALFCPATGKPLTRQCPKCGQGVLPTATECESCGEPLGLYSASTATPNSLPGSSYIDPTQITSGTTPLPEAVPTQALQGTGMPYPVPGNAGQAIYQGPTLKTPTGSAWGRLWRDRRFNLALMSTGLLLMALGAWMMWPKLFGKSEAVQPSVTQELAQDAPTAVATQVLTEPTENLLEQVLPTSVPSEIAIKVPTITLTLPPTATSLPMVTPVALKINSKDNAELVYVPAGEFIMGADKGDSPWFYGAEAPRHTVYLDGYWIYRTEVTNTMYQACVAEKKCPLPVVINDNYGLGQRYGNERFADYPVVLVSWNNAYAYCQWAGARLPTEAEWEKAARGTDGRTFPWGNDPANDELATYGTVSGGPEPVGSHPAGASPYGAYDMAGNVLEWVFDYWDDTYYRMAPSENPKGPLNGDRHAIRGGNYHNLDEALRTAMRVSYPTGDTNIDLGFRCAMNDTGSANPAAALTGMSSNRRAVSLSTD